MEPARCRERQSHPRGGLEHTKASAWSPFRIRGRHSAVSERNTRRTPCSSSAARTAAGNPSCARPSTVLPWFTEGQSPPPRAAHRQSLRWAAELRLTLDSILGACGVEAELLAHPFGRFQNPKYNPDPKRTFLQPSRSIPEPFPPKVRPEQVPSAVPVARTEKQASYLACMFSIPSWGFECLHVLVLFRVLESLTASLFSSSSFLFKLLVCLFGLAFTFPASKNFSHSNGP